MVSLISSFTIGRPLATVAVFEAPGYPWSWGFGVFESGSLRSKARPQSVPCSELTRRRGRIVPDDADGLLRQRHNPPPAPHAPRLCHYPTLRLRRAPPGRAAKHSACHEMGRRSSTASSVKRRKLSVSNSTRMVGMRVLPSHKRWGEGWRKERDKKRNEINFCEGGECVFDKRFQGQGIWFLMSRTVLLSGSSAFVALLASRSLSSISALKKVAMRGCVGLMPLESTARIISANMSRNSASSRKPRGPFGRPLPSSLRNSLYASTMYLLAFL